MAACLVLIASRSEPVPPVGLWAGFHILLLVLLAAELAFSRIGLARLGPDQRSRRQHRNALAATAMWAAAAFALALYLHLTLDGTAATQLLAGYALEQSLSIDNLFIFLLLFRVFNIPATWQPKALFWGVLGAIVMRATFIFAGIGLLTRFAWIAYIFGALLLVAAVRLALPGRKAESEFEPARAPRWLAWVARIHPVSQRTDIFFTREDGRPMLTMLMLSVIAIELTDVVFALDSIPAVLSITRQPFLAYASNILAVMSLRSLYFLLARALKQLRFLHLGLAAILAFAGAKMLLEPWFPVGPLPSLAVIVGVLAVTIAASLARRGSVPLVPG